MLPSPRASYSPIIPSIGKVTSIPHGSKKKNTERDVIQRYCSSDYRRRGDGPKQYGCRREETGNHLRFYCTTPQMTVHCWCSKHEQHLDRTAVVYSTTQTHSVVYRSTLTKLFVDLGDGIEHFFHQFLNGVLVCFFLHCINIMHSLHCHPCNQGANTLLQSIFTPKHGHGPLYQQLIDLYLEGGVYRRHPYRSQQVYRLRSRASRQHPKTSFEIRRFQQGLYRTSHLLCHLEYPLLMRRTI